MQERNILHYGLNRSGTNFLKEILLQQFKLNFMNREDARNHPLHKHFRLYDNKNLIGRPNFQNDIMVASFKEFEQITELKEELEIYVVISKDPYSWNLSYRRWGEKHKWEPSPHPYVFEYNEFYKKWWEFSLESNKIMLIKYSELLHSPQIILDRFSHQFNIEPHEESPSAERIRKVPMSRRFSSRRMKYYLEEKYIEDYSLSELKEVNQYIDHDLIKKLGYESHF